MSKRNHTEVQISVAAIVILSIAKYLSGRSDSFVVKTVCALFFISIGSYAQPSAPFKGVVTIPAERGDRGFSDLINRIQQLYNSPITFEEVPFENANELGRVPIQTVNGYKTFLANPTTAFGVDLDQTLTTPYLAAQLLLATYHHNNLPGAYRVVQQSGRVDIVPTQVRTANGTMRALHSVYGYSYPFPIKFTHNF